MTDIPIIFSAAMIQALLAGRKTMTRRLRWIGKKAADGHGFRESPFARIKPGARLWVREGLALGATSQAWKYRADDTLISMTWPDHRVAQMVAWAHHQERESVPSIHMPRWASRLTLVITAAKIERLQKISEADAIAEGLYVVQGDGCGAGPGYKWDGPGYHGGSVSKEGWGPTFHVAKEGASFGHKKGERCSCKMGGPTAVQCAFHDLWNDWHGAESWDVNPEVVALTFGVHKQNIDAMKEAA